MSNLIWSAEKLPAELVSMLKLLGEEYPILSKGRGLKLEFRPVKSKETVSRVTRKSGSITIEYSNLAAAGRGIGSALSGLDGEERTGFSSLGIMLDQGQGMVMKPEELKRWMRRMILCGYNQLLLYTESSFELEGEPFFGYAEPNFTLEMLQDLDDYAGKLGIELVGCCQVLGHMTNLLRWRGAYGGITDMPTVMLADEPKTYALIEKILDFWSKALRSRRINIGMDETWGLGRGRFLNLHGYEREFDIFNRHLARVNDMCKERGLAPMIWSDMYFRLSNPDHDYHNPNFPVPKDVAAAIPRNVQLAYWDYYSESRELYEKLLDRHCEMGFAPVMASGIWSWETLWYDHIRTAATIRPCIAACRTRKVKELFFTLWEDDGAYCHFDSTLAGVVFASDLSYGQEDEEITARRFEAVCGADYWAQTAAGEMQYIEADPEHADKDSKEFIELTSHCKVINGLLRIITPMILWDDPLLGIAFDDYKRSDPEFDLKFMDKCDELLCRLLPRVEEKNAGNVAHAVNTIRALMAKVELRSSLKAAYDAGDRAALREIAVAMVPAATAAMEEFDRSFTKQWMAGSLPHGLEMIQVRNAGTIARIRETGRRIREFLAGDAESIPELERTLPPSAPGNFLNNYSRVAYGSKGF